MKDINEQILSSDPFPYTYRYRRPAVTADAVIFGWDGQTISILLIQRAHDPFQGAWAFPGGFLNVGDENLMNCARRELSEETGLKATCLEPLCTMSDPQRDPRGVTISQAFMSLMHVQKVVGQDDAAKAQWIPISEIKTLAFDHEIILRQALQRWYQLLSFPIPHTMWNDKDWDTDTLEQLRQAVQQQLFDFI